MESLPFSLISDEFLYIILYIILCYSQHLDQQTVGIQYNYKYKIKEVGFMKLRDVFGNT